jgi:hypothetical protein
VEVGQCWTVKGKDLRAELGVLTPYPNGCSRRTASYGIFSGADQTDRGGPFWSTRKGGHKNPNPAAGHKRIKVRRSTLSRPDFTKLENCSKWEKTRLTLNEGTRVIDVEEGHPRLPRLGSQLATTKPRLREMVPHRWPPWEHPLTCLLPRCMVSSFKDKDDERDENNDQRWKALSDKAEYKIIWRRLRLCQSRRPRHPHPCHKRVGASGGDQDE